MSIPTKPTLTAPPTAPQRTDPPDTFANRADAYLVWQNNYRDELVAGIDWQNTVFTATETEATNAANSATLSEEWATTTGATVDGTEYAAKEYASGTTVPTGSAKEWATETADIDGGFKGARGYAIDASDSATASAASANFKGAWSSLTGALNKPASVRHSGVTWILLNDLADVTASEPGVSGDWDVIYLPDFSSLPAGDYHLAPDSAREGIEWKEVASPHPANVVSSTKTDTATTTSTSWVDTGISCSITLSDPAHRIKLSAVINGLTSAEAAMFRFMRGATVIGVGDAAGAREQASFLLGKSSTSTGDDMSSGVGLAIDAPGSTGPHTYKLQWRVENNQAWINRGFGDSDDSASARTISTIEAMEVV